MVTPSFVLREREASPLTAQMPRNSATELSTTSFFRVILVGKGDIPEVKVQLEHLHFSAESEERRWAEERGPLSMLVRGPPEDDEEEEDEVFEPPILLKSGQT